MTGASSAGSVAFGGVLLLGGLALLILKVWPRVRELRALSLDRQIAERRLLSERVARVTATFLPAVVGVYCAGAGAVLMFGVSDFTASLILVGFAVVLLAYPALAVAGWVIERREHHQAMQVRSALGQRTWPYLASERRLGAALTAAASVLGIVVMVPVLLWLVDSGRLDQTSDEMSAAPFVLGFAALAYVVGAAVGIGHARDRRRRTLAELLAQTGFEDDTPTGRGEDGGRD